ncbi:hypothetical protein C6A85_11275, partial [Mycobacterium sp. ITM-2017-0098]
APSCRSSIAWDPTIVRRPATGPPTTTTGRKTGQTALEPAAGTVTGAVTDGAARRPGGTVRRRGQPGAGHRPRAVLGRSVPA